MTGRGVGAAMTPMSVMKKWLGWFVTACVLGCHRAPPPAPPPPPPIVAAPAPPPPPPKCEVLEESCVAAAATRARIRPGWEFAPPLGWTYAAGEQVTIATGKSAALAMTSREKADPKTERADREDAVHALAEKLEVSLPKRKKMFKKKPDQTEKVGDLDIDLYQVDAARRRDQKGPLLVFSANLPDHRVLFGVGFVTDDDADNSDGAIMTSIHSIARTAADATPNSKKAP